MVKSVIPTDPLQDFQITSDKPITGFVNHLKLNKKLLIYNSDKSSRLGKFFLFFYKARLVTALPFLHLLWAWPWWEIHQQAECPISDSLHAASQFLYVKNLIKALIHHDLYLSPSLSPIPTAVNQCQLAAKRLDY